MKINLVLIKFGLADIIVIYFTFLFYFFWNWHYVVVNGDGKFNFTQNVHSLKINFEIFTLIDIKEKKQR